MKKTTRIANSKSKHSQMPASPVLDTTKTAEPIVDRLAEPPGTVQIPIFDPLMYRKIRAIREAIIANPSAENARIAWILLERGIRVSIEQIRETRGTIERKPTMECVIRNNAAKNIPLDELASLLEELGINGDVNSISRIYVNARADNTDKTRLSKLKPCPELDQTRQKLVEASIYYATKYAKYRWFGHLKGIGSPDDFADFALARLPFIASKFNPAIAKHGMQSWKNFLCGGIRFAEKTYRARVLQETMGISRAQVRILLGAMEDLRKGVSIEESAKNRKTTVENIQELLELYMQYSILCRTVSLDTIEEHGGSFGIGAYSLNEMEECLDGEQQLD